MDLGVSLRGLEVNRPRRSKVSRERCMHVLVCLSMFDVVLGVQIHKGGY